MIFYHLFLYSKLGDKNYYQQGAPPPMAQPVYVGTPFVAVGENPTQCTCPSCGNRIVTRTEKKAGLLAWLLCAIMFFTVLWICCFIPFCVDACKVSIISIWNRFFIFLFRYRTRSITVHHVMHLLVKANICNNQQLQFLTLLLLFFFLV